MSALTADVLPARTNGTCSLKDLVDGFALVDSRDDRCIDSMSLDSRDVHPGGAFMAVPGVESDGRQFIDSAIHNGASAIIFEADGMQEVLEGGFSEPEPFEEGPFEDQPLEKRADTPRIAIDDLRGKVSEIAGRLYGHPSHALDVIGVTGTNGKTTFVYLMTQALAALGTSVGMMGTIGNGSLTRLTKSGLTTSDPVGIQRSLAGFLSEGLQTVCMEVSSHGLSQDRVRAIRFNTAVFTNLSQDHLDYHGTIENYGAQKAKLFQFKELDLAVINHDDEFGRKLLEQNQASRQLSFGLDGGDISPTKLDVCSSGIAFDLEWSEQSVHFRSSLIGRINVSNLLAVITCLLGYGFELNMLPRVIALLRPPPGRMEVFESENQGMPAVVVDYAHTPDALERALKSLRESEDRQLVVVFGCGGDRDQGKRSMMGRVAECYADEVILTDDNPRTECPQTITRQIIEGMTTPPRVIHDRREAIETAIHMTDGNGIVLVAGKGHEESQTTLDGVIDLSDRDVVEQILRAGS